MVEVAYYPNIGFAAVVVVDVKLGIPAVPAGLFYYPNIGATVLYYVYY